MSKKAISNKLLYFVFLLSICAGLILISYYGFMQPMNIDVMLDIQLTYTGDSGSASVTARPKRDDLNQRVAQFMSTVEYEIKPDADLSNGEKITVTALYDAQLAADYHFMPVNTTAEFVVEGLPERYAGLADIPQEYVQQAEEAAGNYLKVQGKEPVYGAFLKGRNGSDPDRFVWIFDGGSEEAAAVFVPEINSSQQVNESAIYSQECYLSSDELKDEDYAEYIRRLYSSSFKIESLDVTGG